MRAWPVVVVATLLLVANLVQIRSYREAVEQHRSALAKPSAPVVVPTDTLTAGTVLTEDDLEVVAWPVETACLPRHALQRPEDAIGSVVTSTVIRGEPLNPARLGASGRRWVLIDAGEPPRRLIGATEGYDGLPVDYELAAPAPRAASSVFQRTLRVDPTDAAPVDLLPATDPALLPGGATEAPIPALCAPLLPDVAVGVGARWAAWGPDGGSSYALVALDDHGATVALDGFATSQGAVDPPRAIEGAVEITSNPHRIETRARVGAAKIQHVCRTRPASPTDAAPPPEPTR